MACKMLKKGLMGVGLGALALGLVFGTRAPSYVKTAFHKIRHGARESVPIHFEIDRARQELADLEPAIRANVENLARAEEDVKDLREELADFRSNLNQEQAQMVALRRRLGAGDILRTGGIDYSADEIKKDLRGRLDHYRQMKRTLTERERTLKMKEEAVAGARAQLKGFIEQRRTLQLQIDEIEARQQAIDASRPTEAFRVDDTALGRVQQTIKELRRRQNVALRADELRGRYLDKRVNVDDETPVGDVIREIDEEFVNPSVEGGKTDDGQTSSKRL